jgi:hypothetical protein
VPGNIGHSFLFLHSACQCCDARRLEHSLAHPAHTNLARRYSTDCLRRQPAAPLDKVSERHVRLRPRAHKDARISLAKQRLCRCRSLALTQISMKAAAVCCTSADERNPNAAFTDRLRSCQKVFLREPLQCSHKRLVILLRNHPQRLQQHDHIIDLLKSRGQTVSRRLWVTAASVCDLAQPLQQVTCRCRLIGHAMLPLTRSRPGRAASPRAYPSLQSSPVCVPRRGAAQSCAPAQSSAAPVRG